MPPLFKTLCLVMLCILPHCTAAFAGKYSITNFDRGKGFPGENVYHVFQDSRNYIWAGTENGLVSYNGYEFKTYTTKEGLPDNDVFRINEDARGRLWIITFSSEMSYMWKGEIFNAGNSPLIRKLSINGIPRSLEIDRNKNIWIGGNGVITRLDNNGIVWKYTHLDKDPIRSDCPMVLDSSGCVLLLNGRKIYRFNSGSFDLVIELPFRSDYDYQHSSYLKAILSEYSWTPFSLFIRNYKSNTNKYYTPQGWDNLTFFHKLSGDKVGMGTAKGFFIKDFASGRTTEHLLAGKKVSWCLAARDNSFWVGSLGSGLFHCVPSMAGAVAATRERSVTSMAPANGGLYYTTDASSLNLVGINEQNEPVNLGETIIDADHPWEFCTYAGQDSRQNWIVAMFGNVYKYTSPGRGRCTVILSAPANR